MCDNMSISVNGQSQVPPGFRFHPTEEELLQYYLRKKVAFEKIDLDVIQDVDLNKLEPWDIQDKCKIGSTPQNDWYFFSHKDKKYPTGTRTNRATAAGFWKATGRDKVIYSNSKRIGMRKTLVFYKGRAPHGQKSDWIMHEYRLDENTPNTNTSIINVCNAMGGSDGSQEEGWVVCRVFKKKSHCPKSIACPIMSGTSSPINSCEEGTLDHILQYMATTTTTPLSRINNNSISDDDDSRSCFFKLPNLQDSPNSSIYQSEMVRTGIHDWSSLDRLVALHLNGQNIDDTTKQFPFTNLDHVHHMPSATIYQGDNTFTFSGCPVDDHQLLQLQQKHRQASTSSSYCDLLSFTESISDQFCHLPNVPV